MKFFFLLVLRHGVTLVWFPFSLLLLSDWALFDFCSFIFRFAVWFWVDVFAMGRFLSGFPRGGIAKALSYNIIRVLSLKGRFLLLVPGWVCFLGRFASLLIQVLLY